MLQARQTEVTASAEQLRRLGPRVPPGEIIASTDDVQVRRPEKRRWLELRTAYVRTAQGLSLSERHGGDGLAATLSPLGLMRRRPDSPRHLAGRWGTRAGTIWSMMASTCICFIRSTNTGRSSIRSTVVTTQPADGWRLETAPTKGTKSAFADSVPACGGRLRAVVAAISIARLSSYLRLR